ncbi:membrane protein [Streptomyces rimosus subsp. rimosus]|nr:membrane protein [Streptomyces rimosus subsp. rimosus]KOT29270.1 membrane protein [Streptomyces sp. NRRL WC-3701]KOT85697.1 membrane protein [Streptomyces rimosus subsp. pseudoverticillatus]KOT88876.1 membrane protein [Streptomyces sp. NRRL F-5755]KOT51007.1 membrane protein [Streptomyces rimosus subsp. rimosus]
MTDCAHGRRIETTGGSAVSEARTPAQIEKDIVRRRQELAVTLDEIGVRLHPKTIMGDAKAKTAAAVDRTAGRAYVAANRAVSDIRAQLVSEDGAPRLERVVPLAMIGVAVVGLLVVGSKRRRS